MAAHQARPLLSSSSHPPPILLLLWQVASGSVASPGACQARQVHNSCESQRGGDLWPMAADEQSGPTLLTNCIAACLLLNYEQEEGREGREEGEEEGEEDGRQRAS